MWCTHYIKYSLDVTIKIELDFEIAANLASNFEICRVNKTKIHLMKQMAGSSIVTRPHNFQNCHSEVNLNRNESSYGFHLLFKFV